MQPMLIAHHIATRRLVARWTPLVGSTRAVPVLAGERLADVPPPRGQCVVIEGRGAVGTIGLLAPAAIFLAAASGNPKRFFATEVNIRLHGSKGFAESKPLLVCFLEHPVNLLKLAIGH